MNKRSQINQWVLIWLLSLAFATTSITAQKAWTGNGDGASWFDSGNWVPSGIPGITDVVTINNPSSAIKIAPPNPADTARAKSLQINNAPKVSLEVGAILLIDGKKSATNNLVLDGGSTFSTAGTVILKGAISDGIKLLNGTFSNGDGAVISILDFANNANGQGIEIESGSMFQNNGYLSIRGPGLQSEDGIVNDGSLQNLSTGTIEINAMHGSPQYYGIENYNLFLNRGLVIIDSIEAASGILISGANGSLQNEGIITTSNILDMTKSGVSISDGATLSGEGTLNCHLATIGSNNSILSPGTASGQMTINGTLFMNDEARFKLEIVGRNGPGSNTGHDRLEVLGDIIMENNGLDKPTLEVVLLNNFVPAINETFSFMKFSGSIDGYFGSTIDKPSGLTGWFWDNRPIGQLAFRRYCGGSSVIEDCATHSCEIWSGYYDSSSELIYLGPHVIPSGETVQFQSTQIELSSGFSVEAGALFEVTIGPCGT